MYRPEELCLYCYKAEVTDANDMFFCDNCDRGAHRQCDPQLSKLSFKRTTQIAKNKKMAWICARCTLKEKCVDTLPPRTSSSTSTTSNRNSTNTTQSDNNTKNNKKTSTTKAPMIIARDNDNDNDNNDDGGAADIAVFGASRTAATKKKFFLPEAVKALYCNEQLRSASNASYCGTPDGAIDGSMRPKSMQRVFDILQTRFGMDPHDPTIHFADLGSGVGKPCFHAWALGYRNVTGVELSKTRCELAQSLFSTLFPRASIDSVTDNNVVRHHRHPRHDDDRRSHHHHSRCDQNRQKQLQKHSPQKHKTLSEAPTIRFLCANLQCCPLEGYTHIYSFSACFPPRLMHQIADHWNQSSTTRAIALTTPPHKMIFKFGFKVNYVMRLACYMHGSGEQHSVYFYERVE